MNVRASDYWLMRLNQLLRGPLRWLGDIETNWLNMQLKGCTIERPIMIGGLARSGSTMLLELFAKVPDVVTHRYRDFPFVAIPVLWNRWLDRVAQEAAPVDRPHQDRIKITQQSPEGMEEVLWNLYGPHLSALSTLDDSSFHTNHLTPAFTQFYRAHIQKLLWLRGGTRYVSKNNLHISRMKWILELLPTAEFVVPIRHPMAHCASLARQHRLFCGYSLRDRRVPDMLAAAGHLEFGPQRQPRGCSAMASQQVAAHWLRGHEAMGYAVQWREVYGRVLQCVEDEQLQRRVHVVRYEDFCAGPQPLWDKITERLGLDGSAVSLAHIDPDTVARADAMTVEEHDVWQLTRDIAETFGYQQSQ